MVYNAQHRFARISSRKVKPVLDLIRNKYADDALDILKHLPHRSARMIENGQMDRSMIIGFVSSLRACADFPRACSLRNRAKYCPSCFSLFVPSSARAPNVRPALSLQAQARSLALNLLPRRAPRALLVTFPMCSWVPTLAPSAQLAFSRRRDGTFALRAPPARRTQPPAALHPARAAPRARTV